MDQLRGAKSVVAMIGVIMMAGLSPQQCYCSNADKAALPSDQAGAAALPSAQSEVVEPAADAEPPAPAADAEPPAPAADAEPHAPPAGAEPPALASPPLGLFMFTSQRSDESQAPDLHDGFLRPFAAFGAADVHDMRPWVLATS